MGTKHTSQSLYCLNFNRFLPLNFFESFKMSRIKPEIQKLSCGIQKCFKTGKSFDVIPSFKGNVSGSMVPTLSSLVTNFDRLALPLSQKYFCSASTMLVTAETNLSGSIAVHALLKTDLHFKIGAKNFSFSSTFKFSTSV
jgi:hypothetical protein